MYKRRVIPDVPLLGLLYSVKRRLERGGTLDDFMCPMFVEEYRKFLPKGHYVSETLIFIKYYRFRNWIAYHGRGFKRIDKFDFNLYTMSAWICSQKIKIKLITEFITELEGEKNV